MKETTELFQMNLISSVFETFWNFVTDNYPDKLTLADTERGQCYNGRRSPESRKEFQSKSFKNVNGTTVKRRVRLTLAKKGSCDDKKPTTNRQIPRKSPPTSCSRTPTSSSSSEVSNSSSCVTSNSSCDDKKPKANQQTARKSSLASRNSSPTASSSSENSNSSSGGESNSCVVNDHSDPPKPVASPAPPPKVIMWSKVSSGGTASSHEFFDSLTSSQAQGSAPGFTPSNAGGTSALFSQQHHNDVASSFENTKGHDPAKNNIAAYFTSVDPPKPAGQTWPAQFVPSSGSAMNQSYNNIVHQQPELQSVPQSDYSSGVYNPPSEDLRHPPAGQNSEPFLGESNHHLETPSGFNSTFAPPRSGYNPPYNVPHHPPVGPSSDPIQSGSNHVQPSPTQHPSIGQISDPFLSGGNYVQPSPTQLSLGSTISPPPAGENPPNKEPQQPSIGQISDPFLSGGNYVQPSPTQLSLGSTVSPPPAGENPPNKEPQQPSIGQISDPFLSGGNYVQPSPTQLSLGSTISPPPAGENPPNKEPQQPSIGQISDPFLSGGNYVQPSPTQLSLGSTVSPPPAGENPPNKEPRQPSFGQISDPFLSGGNYVQPSPTQLSLGSTISPPPARENPPNKEPRQPSIGQISEPSSVAQSWSSTISPPPSGFNPPINEPQLPPVSQNSDPFLSGGNHVEPSSTTQSWSSTVSPPPSGYNPSNKEPHHPLIGQNSDPFGGDSYVQPKPPDMTTTISQLPSGYSPPNKEPPHPPTGQNSDPFLRGDGYVQPTPPDMTTTVSQLPSGYCAPNKETHSPPIGQNSDPFPSGDNDVQPSSTQPTLTSLSSPPSSAPLSSASSLFQPGNEGTTETPTKEPAPVFPVAPCLPTNHVDSGSDDMSASQKPDQHGISGGNLPPEIGNTVFPTSASKKLETNVNSMSGNSNQNMSVAPPSHVMPSERITDPSTTTQSLFSQPSAALTFNQPMSPLDIESFASAVKPPSMVEYQRDESTMNQQKQHLHQGDINSHLYPPGVTKASLDAPAMTWSALQGGVSCQTQGLYPPGAQEALTASFQPAPLAVSPPLNLQAEDKESHVETKPSLQRKANTRHDGRVPSHDQHLSAATFGVQRDTLSSQKQQPHLPPSFDVESKTSLVTLPEPSPVIIPEGTSQLQDSPAKTDSDIHTSAFHPVKSNSPYDRPDLESPLRSPVQREKRETILPGSKYQTSSLWDNSDPQLAIPGLVVPIATKGNRFELVSGQDHRDSVLTDSKTRTSQQAASWNIGTVQHAMYGSTNTTAKTTGFELKSHPSKEALAKSSSLPSTVDKQKDFPTSSDNPLGHVSSSQAAVLNSSRLRLQPQSSYSGQSSTSTVSRQSSIGISSQDHVGSEIDAAHELSGFDRGHEQRPSIDQAPSMSDGPSSRSRDHVGLVQNEQALMRQGNDGGVVPGVSGVHGYGHNEGQVTQELPSSYVRKLQQQQLGYQQQTAFAQQQKQQHEQQQQKTQQQFEQPQLQEQQIQKQQKPLQQQQVQQQQVQQQQLQQQQLHQQQLQQQQLQQQQAQQQQLQQQQAQQQQLQEQQQLEQLRQQLYGQQHMDHQQRTDYEQYMQHQQQLEQHQLLQRQTSGQYQQQVSSNADQQYQINNEQQQYEDYDSEEECNRYYDESRKWFWSNKRHKWIRADKSKRDSYAGYQDQRYYDERYRSESGRNRYEDDDRGYGERRHGRRRDQDPRRQSRGRSEYDYEYRAYYDKYYHRDYYQRTYQRGESDSSDSSADSQRRGTRSDHSSRGQSPHSTSSRSSSRARRSGRKLKSSKSYDYADGYRKDEDQYRSQQSSRSSRRLSSASYSSSTSNSLSDSIKWNDQPKQQENDRTVTEYVVERAVTPERLTPKQHTVPHVVCKFNTVSRMSITPARRVLDGETAQVILTDVTCDPRSSQLMQNFPGPLCRGKTHKRDIVKFTKDMALSAFNNQNKSFEEREASYILWEVLAVMVQQNGVYLNSDIAEVLTSELPPDTSSEEPEKLSPPSSRRVSFGSESHSSLGYNQDVLDTYREYLLCGKTQDALEFAIKSKMWGHALTLAYQLDQNIFFNIMSRFTDNLSDDDSLLCLYQHLSQQRPLAVDKKSKRWRKHLAMMIANPSKSPAQDIKNIHALGKNLESRGLIEAAHLCYIVAGEPMSKENGMVLLGYSLNGVKPEFADLLAIQRTEIYEYAMRLRDENFLIKDFQPWKEFYANKLADEGLHNKAYRYCETIVENILKQPTLFTEDNIVRLHTLSVRLHKRELITPVLDMNDKLKRLLDLTQGIHQQSEQQYWQPSTQYEPSIADGNQTLVEGTQPFQSQTIVSQEENFANNDASHVPTLPSMFVPSNPQENTYYPPVGVVSVFSGSQQPETPQRDVPYGTNVEADPSSETPETRFFGAPSESGRSLDFYEGDSFEHLLKNQPSGNPTDQVESSGLSTSTSDTSFDYYAQSNFRNDKNGTEAAKETASKESEEAAKSEKKDDKKKEKQGGGWSFGGFFKALIPKGKNEMILPDDKKKTIYWDEKEKKWINTQADEEDKTDLPPPPIDPSLNNSATPAVPLGTPGLPTPTSVTSSANHFNQPNGSVTSSNTSQPPAVQAPPFMGDLTPDQPENSLINTPLTTPSRFSRRALGSKARKSNYVDVLSASGSTTKLNDTVSPMLFQPFPTAAGNQAPVSNVLDNQPNMDDTTRPPVSQNNVNNIGDEQPNSTQVAQPPAMPFFNPADFTAPSSSPSGRSRLYPKAKK